MAIELRSLTNTRFFGRRYCGPTGLLMGLLVLSACNPEDSTGSHDSNHESSTAPGDAVDPDGSNSGGDDAGTMGSGGGLGSGGGTGKTPEPQPDWGQHPEFDWGALSNPVLEHTDRTYKDCSVGEHNGFFYIYTSAFYENDGDVHCHVYGAKTKNFIDYHEVMNTYGKERGYNGMCSPSIQKVGDKWLLTYNAWSTDHQTAQNPPPNDDALFYQESTDLENWSAPAPFAKELIQATDYNGPLDAIYDTAVGQEGGTNYMIVNVRTSNGTKISVAKSASFVDGWTFINDPLTAPSISLETAEGVSLDANWAENWQLLKVNGKWTLVAIKFSGENTGRYAFTMKNGSGDQDADWLAWDSGVLLERTGNSPFIMDRTGIDGFLYIISARTYMTGKTFEPIDSWDRKHQKLVLQRTPSLGAPLIEAGTL